MIRTIPVGLLLVAIASCGGGTGTSVGSSQSAAAPASASTSSSATRSPSTDAAGQFRTELEAALHEFEGSWLLFCLGVDDGGHMPRTYAFPGGSGLRPAIDVLNDLDPPKGWLAVANEAKDLAGIADKALLSAALVYGTFKQGSSYEAADLVWQDKVIARCVNPANGIRLVREHADGIP